MTFDKHYLSYHVAAGGVSRDASSNLASRYAPDFSPNLLEVKAGALVKVFIPCRWH